MKKLLTLAAASLVSAAAFAVVPSTYNYQGVCNEKEANVTVKFELVQNGQQVYAETQEVATNNNGLFTAKVGNGQAVAGEWDAIDWTEGGLKLLTYVNDDLAAQADIVAVPYATVAETALNVEGLDVTQQDVMELTLANRERATELAVMKQGMDAFINTLDAELNKVETEYVEY